MLKNPLQSVSACRRRDSRYSATARLGVAMALFACLGTRSLAQETPSLTRPASETATSTPPAIAPQARAAGPVAPKLLRYAERIVRSYDKNHNGQLEADEWRAMRGKPETADLDQDGVITVAEFAAHVANFGVGRAIRLPQSPLPLAQQDTPGNPAAPAPEASATPAEAAIAPDPRRGLKYFAAIPAGVPAWFVERDLDGDGQLILSEYSPKLLRGEIEEFNRYDANRDGVVTSQELLRPSKAAQGPTDNP